MNKKQYVYNMLTQVLPDIRNNGVHYPTLKDFGYGGGKKAWSKYHIGFVYAAQYMSPFLLTDDHRVINSTNYNLCGPLAVANALGIPLEEAMRLLLVIPQGIDIMNTPGIGTAWWDLIAFFKAGGFEAHMVQGGMVWTKEQFEASLKAGEKIVSLVNISPGGVLKDVHDPDRDIAHWVDVSEIIRYAGRTLVKVYNPFNNDFQIYSWKTFNAAHRETAGNSGNFISVIAE